MKILMVNKFLYPNGGSETYIFKIGEELQRRGHEVQYFGMEHEGRVVSNHLELYTKGMDFHSGKLQKLLYPFKILYSFEARKKMYQILEDMQPDVVHLNNINFQLTPSVIDAVLQYQKKHKTRIKIIYTAHDYQWVCPNHMMRHEVKDTNGNIASVNCEECTVKGFKSCSRHRCIHGSRMRSILGTMEAELYRMRKTYEKVDTIICPSEFMQQKISTNKVLASKTVMLRNFIEKDEQNHKSDKAQALLDNKLPKEYVLYLGRFSEEKGVRTLLKVCRQCPDIPFLFAGSGPLEDEVNKLSNVENLGFVRGEKLKQLVNGARFSIYPSEWYENGPFSVMESIEAGTPVIGAAIGGIPELIRQEETGLLFESGNVDALKDAVKRLWNDREQNARMMQNCASVCFDSAADYCDRLLEVYKREA